MRKVCAVCHTWIRGSGFVHSQTAKHRRALAGPIKRHSRMYYQVREGVRPAWMSRAVEGDDKIKVSRYRRRRPLDGPRKSVKIRSYWRGLPYVAVRDWTRRARKRLAR